MTLQTIMTRDVFCASPELELPRVIALMVHHHIGCLPVVDAKRCPIGIITKLDLVEQFESVLRGDITPGAMASRTAALVMMPLAMTLDQNAPITSAAEMMLQEDTHHVLVTNAARELVGIVSAKDIVRWAAREGRAR